MIDRLIFDANLCLFDDARSDLKSQFEKLPVVASHARPVRLDKVAALAELSGVWWPAISGFTDRIGLRIIAQRPVTPKPGEEPTPPEASPCSVEVCCTVNSVHARNLNNLWSRKENPIGIDVKALL